MSSYDEHLITQAGGDGDDGMGDVARALRHAIHTAHCLERVHGEGCTFWGDDATSAEAVIAAGFGLVPEARRIAWEEGFASGKSRAMRHMSDEPNLPLSAPNPYRTALGPTP